GSGPTVAFLAPDADAAADLQRELSSARLSAVRVSGPVHGARLLST
ncbi:4-(cytidine 5'-diphospho)-2-C-methyl-D-erythritol kinase, partial [Rathayibacter rathayi]